MRALLLAVAIALVAGGSVARAAAPPTLTVEVLGEGKVTGLGIDCGLGSLACYATYGSTQTPTLTPTPASGWTFDHWDDGCVASPCAPAVSGPVTVTAVFASTAPTVQTATYGVSLAGNGTVTNGSTANPIDCEQGAATMTECSLSVLQGSTLTVVEQPDSAYFFSRWGGACTGTGVSCSAYLTDNTFVSAQFISSATNQLTVEVSGNGSVSGGGISCGQGSSCDAQEPPSSSVTLTATPANGYGLTGWSGDCTGTQPTCTVQMDTDRSVTATFAPFVQLSVTVSGSGTVSGGGITCGPGPQTCSGSELPNTSVSLTATPSTGASVFWSGCATSSGPNCTVDDRLVCGVGDRHLHGRDAGACRDGLAECHGRWRRRCCEYGGNRIHLLHRCRRKRMQRERHRGHVAHAHGRACVRHGGRLLRLDRRLFSLHVDDVHPDDEQLEDRRGDLRG